MEESFAHIVTRKEADLFLKRIEHFWRRNNDEYFILEESFGKYEYARVARTPRDLIFVSPTARSTAD